MAEEVQAILEREGVCFHLASECVAFAPGDATVRVRARCEPQGLWLEGSHVLLAMGRTPNSGDLGLESAGIRAEMGASARVAGAEAQGNRSLSRSDHGIGI